MQSEKVDFADLEYGSETCNIKGRIVSETSAALLFEFNGTKWWFPLSAVNKLVRHPLGSGEKDVCNIATWMLRRKGIL